MTKQWLFGNMKTDLLKVITIRKEKRKMSKPKSSQRKSCIPGELGEELFEKTFYPLLNDLETPVVPRGDKKIVVFEKDVFTATLCQSAPKGYPFVGFFNKEGKLLMQVFSRHLSYNDGEMFSLASILSNPLKQLTRLEYSFIESIECSYTGGESWHFSQINNSHCLKTGKIEVLYDKGLVVKSYGKTILIVQDEAGKLIVDKKCECFPGIQHKINQSISRISSIFEQLNHSFYHYHRLLYD